MRAGNTAWKSCACQGASRPKDKGGCVRPASIYSAINDGDHRYRGAGPLLRRAKGHELCRRRHRVHARAHLLADLVPRAGGRSDGSGSDRPAGSRDRSDTAARLDGGRSILKVFHAARQDVEIFFNLSGTVPEPLFDTQIAAMVCGFGDAASYETLVGKLAQASLDKSSRFTDWSRRPLTERQIRYALADVVHLRTVYEGLQQRLASNGRAAWFAEDMAELANPRYIPERTERGVASIPPARPGRSSVLWRPVRGRSVAGNGGSAAQPAARPHHEGRGGARDRRARAEDDGGAGADRAASARGWRKAS